MSNNNPPVVIIMAAGKSTRMKSRTPKVLHRIAGRAVIDYIIEAASAGCNVQDAVAVIGYQADRVREHLESRWGSRVRYAIQEPQNGTGHAVMQAEPLLRDFDGDVLTLAGDTPLVSPDILGELLRRHRESGAAATVLTTVMDDPSHYGRVVRAPDGTVSYIVEARDASDDEKAVREINTSIYCFRAPDLFRSLASIRPNNAQGEYYLTDVVALMAREGQRVEAVVSPDPAVVMGVNTRVELADAAAIVRRRKLNDLMLAGVTIIDPATTYVDADVSVGEDSTLYPGTVLEGATTIGRDCVVGPFTHLVDSALGDGVVFAQSKGTLAEVAEGVNVGPFAHLRPGTVVDRDARVGSFVELKQTHLGKGVHVSHLSYVGDANVGDGANIGGGTITCNYDGRRKHRTEVGPGAFIGSNSTLVAPVSVGDGAYTAAGSTITEDVPSDALGIGRARQVVKEGWAARRRADEDE